MDEILADMKQELLDAYVKSIQRNGLLDTEYLTGLQDAARILGWHDVVAKMQKLTRDHYRVSS